MTRLHPDTLDQVSDQVQLPAYDCQALRPGIVHLGLGAFHRAHQAVYTEQALANSGGDWGIIGVSLRSPTVSEQLSPQEGLYSVMSEDASGQQLQVIGAIQKVLVAPRELDQVVAAIADPDIKIITLTVTEKGYCLAPNGWSLDRESEAVRADLANVQEPETAVGILALGLKARHETGAGRITIISCDNLSQNSTVLRSVLIEYVECAFPELLPWLGDNIAYPCSMVDRIVPAMTDEQKQRQGELLGLADEGAVSTEPFSQWIIENKFVAQRPDWESAGVQLVDNIGAYENIKLGLLNASHSAIAYCGLLAGLQTVDQVMSDPALRTFIEELMIQDLMPAFDVPSDFDLPDYRDELLSRFCNPCLGHRCEQIAMDGSEKISQRWLPALRTPAPTQKLVGALSAWAYFILFTDLPVDDPKAEQLLTLRASKSRVDDRLDDALAAARVSVETIGDYFALRKVILKNLKVLQGEGIQALVSS